MRCFKKFLVASCVLFIIAAIGFWVWLSNHYVVPIMMYHNVNYADEIRPNTVNPEIFDRHMAYLHSRGFNVISFDELVQKTISHQSVSKKSVVITFDDAYKDNYTYAYKTLKRYGYPAIVFAPSDLINKKEHLNWDQMREMIQGGIAFGSHTRFHAYLPDLPVEQQRNEIFESKRILEQQLGVPVDYFSYPVGGFSEPIKRLVREAGYKGAAATNRGYDRMNRDVFELNRIRFGDKDVRDDYLWIKLSGYYNLFRAAKKPY